jgi:hypothetical protein
MKYLKNYFKNEKKCFFFFNIFFLIFFQVKMLGLEVTDGKIHARELTEKELRLQEEAANAKNKKATKKDAK